MTGHSVCRMGLANGRVEMRMEMVAGPDGNLLGAYPYPLPERYAMRLAALLPVGAASPRRGR
ncbi:MAG: hypothetical protein KKD25_09555 [Gammaproteobacteria bacterium]|nr:hypothetical protein [Gammaproteobacteria bacterium]MBU0771233.1 hypothetical protein [Gammaproteobacteria bacterium]MBU0856479.1 hypothetical protein [Gammaproteobacteria bacterium]MBU1847446.1 hypothetical protein [Gammaproteobacteria bacterium]